MLAGEGSHWPGRIPTALCPQRGLAIPKVWLATGFSSRGIAQDAFSSLLGNRDLLVAFESMFRGVFYVRIVLSGVGGLPGNCVLGHTECGASLYACVSVRTMSCLLCSSVHIFVEVYWKKLVLLAAAMGSIG